METSYLEQIMGQLPPKMVFPYFRDRYALLLLADFVGDEGKTVAELKKSPLKGWLNKPLVKNLCSSYSLLTREILFREAAWKAGTEFFKITFGEWGKTKKWNQNWLQMSRRGKHLVVQLNFSSDHNHQYRKIWPDSNFPGVGSGHPVHEKGEFTLAWARVDLEPASEVAIIEEIQTDWVRDIKNDLKWEKDYVEELDEPCVESLEDLKKYKQYCDHLLPRVENIWAEAILMATLHVLKSSLGIRKIYFHSAASGLKWKGLGRCGPPRSLYTSLPKKMGFQKTSCLPGWLANRYAGNLPALKRKGRASRHSHRHLEKELALLEAFREGKMHMWYWELG